MPEGSLISTEENKEYISSISGLQRAISEGAILESTVYLCDGEMNLHVDLHGLTGIIEKDEVLYSPTNEPIKDIAIITRVGKPICFKVMGFEEQNGRTVARLSRREAQMECIYNYTSNLSCGDIIPARVTHLESFGAFVDIGCGLVSLLSIDCISVSRISHPKDRLDVGASVWVAVKSIDRELGRIFVSMRELLGTWEENASCFEAGQTVAGIVRSVEPYGIFVELAPNLAGLAEVKTDGSIDDPEQLIGKCTAVYIKSIIPEKMKIKLVIVDPYNSETKKMPIKYYINGNKCHHLSKWRYSPNSSQKNIETDFC